MGSIPTIILVYVAGGITFVPLLLTLVLLHAYWTFPTVLPKGRLPDSHDQQLEAKQKEEKEKAYLANLPKELQQAHESDVAAAYFAVCREYVPGGVNGRPPERTTPAGAVVATESPSVYQSMYRSIFDRKSGAQHVLSHQNTRPAKRARNIFFVILRHGHLMLYEDAEQLEVKHVVPLEHHDVSIFGGEDEEIPEGELWIKRNAIRLQWSGGADKSISVSQPYYLFSENCSDKEDFYFAILQNKRAKFTSTDSCPDVQKFDVKHIIRLVQRLHSSEEQLQTRWINALMGRMFLAMYKTPDVEDYIRGKITKKISRVKKPAFLSGIVVEKIDLGEGGPYFTNPKLRDLTVDGECCAEMDVEYEGNFRIVISTRVRIDLGARFKVREVDLVLAVVVRKVQGHALVKIKPPPSNRLWIAFEQMPTVELSIEPIVSSRQITYTLILRAIENRIKEVIAETCVLPNWDDLPFKDTSDQEYRGGIWATGHRPASDPIHVRSHISADETVTANEDHTVRASVLHLDEDRSRSSPALPQSTDCDLGPQKQTTMPVSSGDGTNEASSTSVETGPPKAIRSRSFASAADPLLSIDNAIVDKKIQTPQEQPFRDATASMKAISSKSPPTSPTTTPQGTPSSSTLWQNSQRSKNLSISSIPPAQPIDTVDYLSCHGPPKSPLMPSTSSTSTSLGSRSMKSASTNESLSSKISHSDASHKEIGEKRYSSASLAAATTAAKRWGWDIVAKASERKLKVNATLDPHRVGTPNNPIGASHPLPEHEERPPLPFWKGPNGQSSSITPKRKPIPPPLANGRSPRETQGPESGEKVIATLDGSEDMAENGLLVVKAPPESEPMTPTTNDIVETTQAQQGEGAADDRLATHAVSATDSQEHEN